MYDTRLWINGLRYTVIALLLSYCDTVILMYDTVKCDLNPNYIHTVVQVYSLNVNTSYNIRYTGGTDTTTMCIDTVSLPNVSQHYVTSLAWGSFYI